MLKFQLNSEKGDFSPPSVYVKFSSIGFGVIYLTEVPLILTGLFLF